MFFSFPLLHLPSQNPLRSHSRHHHFPSLSLSLSDPSYPPSLPGDISLFPAFTSAISRLIIAFPPILHSFLDFSISGILLEGFMADHCFSFHPPSISSQISPSSASSSSLLGIPKSASLSSPSDSSSFLLSDKAITGKGIVTCHFFLSLLFTLCYPTEQDLASPTLFCTTNHLRDPRATAGDIFAMYTGAIMTPKPIPTLANNLPIISTRKEGATAGDISAMYTGPFSANSI